MYKSIILIIVASLTLLGCQENRPKPTSSSSFHQQSSINLNWIKDKMKEVLMQDWNIAEVLQDQYPNHWPQQGPKGYKVIIKGPQQKLSIRREQDKLIDQYSIQKQVPIYCVWIMPADYQDLDGTKKRHDLEKKLKMLFVDEDKEQRHYPFMHPHLIGITSRFSVFAWYPDGQYLSEPLQLTWEVLTKRLQSMFELVQIE